MIRHFYLKRRRWALLIATAALALFASCAKKGEDAAASGDPDYPINISIFSMATAQQPPSDNKIYKWIADNLHVTFTWDILVGEKDQKIGVMIASGDYPDLLDVDSDKFYEAGALVPLDDLIDKHAPRLKKHYAEAWEKMKADDGKVYVLPVWGVMSGIDHSAWYGDSALWAQKEVLKEFGYPKIKTMDEYFDILIKYKERYPTIDGMPTIGFTILTYDWRSFCLINPPNFLAGYPNDGNGTVDPVTHEYKVFLYQDISKRWFKKLNELNAVGLIDRSCFVDNYDQYLAKISSGRVLGFHDQAWQFQNAEATLANQGMYNRTYAPLPIVFDESIRPRYRNRKLPNIGQGIGISVKAKDPARIVRFLDAQLADDVQKIIGYYGILGEDYQLDEDGTPYRTETQRLQQEDGVWILHNQAALWRSHAPKIEGSYDDGLPSNIADIFGEREALMKSEDKELWTAYGVESHAGLMDPDPPPNSVWFPTWQINTPDGSDAQMAWQKAEELYRKYLPRIILGRPDRFEDLWQEYISELSQVGLEKYEAFYQNAVNERVRKWSPKD
ncbi:MAG: extracellular solute-binding protein [Treponema sp.]|jgi:putative aldouronate transport system substrate-binding protein|nr:extracellular solute-binding protein [Treponema sp.]